MSASPPTLTHLALRVNELLTRPGSMAEARRLTEISLADPVQSRVDALQFPTDPNNPLDWTPESLARERGMEEYAILTPGQTALVVSALHDVYCNGVEKVFAAHVEPAAPPDGPASVAYKDEFARWLRLARALEEVRKLGEYSAPWFTLQVRRFDSITKADSGAVETSDPDQRLMDIKARDRAERQKRQARESELRRQDSERQRIPAAIEAMRRWGPLEGRSADEVWLDLLGILLDAFEGAGQRELLAWLPDRGDARRFTRRCSELVAAGKRSEAVEGLKDIEPLGRLDEEIARERFTDLPEDLYRLLGISVATESPAGVRPTPVESLSFEEVVCHLLYGDSEVLPSTRTDGFEGDVYWNKADFAELCRIVCSRVTWVTAKDWWDADKVQRLAYMRAAIAAETGNDRDACADQRPPIGDDFLPIASDVPDLGIVETVSELWKWCNRHREGLRLFKIRLGEPPPSMVALAEFRVIPELISECRKFLLGFGAKVEDIPEKFGFPSLPRHQTPTGPDHYPSDMEKFIAWASGYRAPGHGIWNLIGAVEDFLTWAMQWCKDVERKVTFKDDGAAPTICYYGGKAYSIGASGPITVTDPEDAVLQAFLSLASMDGPMLGEKSGYGDRADSARFEEEVQRPICRRDPLAGRKGWGRIPCDNQESLIARIAPTRHPYRACKSYAP